MLGISKKRLLSIINATKCPTDTESSDSGSDVEKIEGKSDLEGDFFFHNQLNFVYFVLEHISLEEISSDSNDELSKPKKKKKREQNKGMQCIKFHSKIKIHKPFCIVDPLPNKTVVPAKPAEQNGENVEKQYSVLELLELQARARAIRSQLALEPVTKIELDDSDAESSPPSKEKEVDQNAETASVPVQKDNSQKTKDQPKHTQDQTKMPATRPVRLKRNFRQRQTEGYESDENQMAGENEKTNADEPQSVEPEKQKSPMKDADNASAVANDDDVVPIIAEPEVLCISSSDSESDDKSTSSKVKKYINMPVVEKIDRPPTEDELFLLKIKEKSEAKLKSDIVVNKDGKTTERATDDVQIVEKETKDNPNEEQETEDGEIIEEDEIVEIAESPERPQVEEKLEENKTVTAKGTIDTEMNESILKESEKEVDKSQDIHDSNSSASESEDDKKSSDSEDSSSDSESSEIKSRSLESRNSKKSNADDDDDDIIDLGKDEDLDFEQLEMSTAREEPKKVESPRRNTRSKTKSRKSDEREKSTEPKVCIRFCLLSINKIS